MTDSRYVHGGACECGAVRFEYHSSQPLEAQTARQCQCDFCGPRQASYLSARDAELHVHLKDERYLYAHRFATGTADFMHCAVCNAQVYVASNIDDRHYALVYAPALDEFAVLKDFSDCDYDGEGLSDRLARRANNWIPSLNMHIHRES